MNQLKNKNILIIPTYNCEKQILRTLDKVDQCELKTITKIMILDNLSQDQTLSHAIEKVKTLNKSYQIIQHVENYGLGGSFKTAIKIAREEGFQYLFWLHGDDQAEPMDIIHFENIINSISPDCVFGSRFMKGSVLNGYSKIREWGNRIINIIYSIFLNEPVYELGSGLNAYKIEKLPLDIESWPNHIAFDANLLFHFLKNDFNVKWQPIIWNERDQVSNARNFKVAFDLLKMLFRFFLKKELSKSSEFNQNRKFEVY